MSGIRIVGFNAPRSDRSLRDVYSKSSPSASEMRDALPELVLQFDDGTFTTVSTSRRSISEIQVAVAARKKGQLRTRTVSNAEVEFSPTPPPAMTRFERELDL